MSDRSLTKKEFISLLQAKNEFIQEKDSYYFLRGEEDSIKKRKESEKEYVTKLDLAKKATKLLSHIPSILFVGISGSLAAGSVKKDDDIDFFIITSPSTLWSSRLFAVMLLSLTHMRRKRGVKKASNKICLNSFVSTAKLSYFSLSQDLYTARELAQLYPLLNKEKTYELLLEKNSWYRKFLPHADARNGPVTRQSLSRLFTHFFIIINPFCAFLQLKYMKKHRTKEVVESELLLLHPHDYKSEILNRFRRKLMEYDLLTKE